MRINQKRCAFPHYLIIIIIVIFVSSGCNIRNTDILKIDSVSKSYNITDNIEFRLINNSKRTIVYHYTAEFILNEKWTEWDYSLDRISKVVILRELQPGESILLNWPLDIRVKDNRTKMNCGNKFRFLVYYTYKDEYNLDKHGEFANKTHSSDFILLCPNENLSLENKISEKTWKLEQQINKDLPVSSPKDKVVAYLDQKKIDYTYDSENRSLTAMFRKTEETIFVYTSVQIIFTFNSRNELIDYTVTEKYTGI